MASVADYAEQDVVLSIPEFAKGGVPAMITPGTIRTHSELVKWVKENRSYIDALLVEHGAVLFRGFPVGDAQDFEDVALGVDPGLQNDYLGTSPRDAVTKYVFSASELPGFYPIPQHCEMTFLKNPPDRLFFFCDIAPSSRGGETPLADFQRVWEDLPEEVRDAFATRGLKIIRNYSGPDSTGRDLWKLKPWHEMFHTTDREEVTRRCREEGFEPIWRNDDHLTLISYQPAIKAHPVTGRDVWFNHSQVFHLSTASSELARAALLDGNVRSGALSLVASLMVAVRRRLKDAELQSMHCQFGDGGEIPDAYMEEVRNAIWRNLVRYRWQEGDVICIDNHRVSHGRMPYKGPRRVLVAWA